MALVGSWSATNDPVKSGLTVADLTGNGNDGTFQDTVAWVANAEGNGTHAWQFSDVKGWIEIGNIAALKYPTARTYTIWAKFDSTASSSCQIFNFYPELTNAAQGRAVYTPSSGLLALHTRSSSYRSFAGVAINDAWHHLTFVYPSTLTAAAISEAKIYVDGVLQTGGSTIPGPDDPEAPTAFRIGHDTDFAGKIKGLYDSVRVYSHELTQTEITDLYNAGRAENLATPPTVSSVTVDTAGTTVQVNYSENVTGQLGFQLDRGGNKIPLTGVAPTDGTNQHDFTPASTIYSGETVTLEYTPGDAEDDNSTPLASFTGHAVTNNSSQTAPTLSDVRRMLHVIGG